MAKKPPEHKHIAKDLRALAVPIDSLTPDAANARLHDERNIAVIEASFKRFGQRHPLVATKKNRVVRAGNGRLIAARSLGWTHIAAIFIDEDTAEASAFAVADNRSAELARWDKPALAAIAAQLDDDQLGATGFTRKDVEAAATALENTEPMLGELEYRVIVRCKDEHDQAAVLARMESEGYQCQLLMS